MWKWELDELDKIIINLRLASRSEKIVEFPKQYLCAIYTNLANTFDEIGRFIEAIRYFNKALAISPSFSEAIGNKGIAFKFYGLSLYDKSHRAIYFNKAYEHLKKALNGNLHSSIRAKFENEVQWFEYNVSEQIFSHKFKLEGYSMGESDDEIEYRRWCLNERLFINPINDLGCYSIANQDVLHMPPLVAKIGEGPYFHGFFNAIKQEYVSARYLFYEGRKSNNPHFCDRNVLLLNTLDYPKYGLGVEKIKISFRMSYSIFDKIAYFLNEYLNIGISKDRVNFRNMWYEEGKRKKGLNAGFEKKENWPLRGLFWLAKDIYSVDKNFHDSIEPESQKINEIRNHLEHKYLKIHDELWSGIPQEKSVNSSLFFDSLSYSVYYDEFENYSLNLLRLTRSALIYLSLAVHAEEKTRFKEREKGITPPMSLGKIEDEWKS